jgi:hypothetical protein
MRTGRSHITPVAVASLVIMALAFTSAQAGQPPKDPKPPKEDPQGDIPVCVEVCSDSYIVPDTGPPIWFPTAVRPDGAYLYCHLGRKEGTLMGIWGDSGRFDMVVNKKERVGERSMLFHVPEPEPGVAFEGPTLPPWPADTYEPLSVGMVTARESVGFPEYVHLLGMSMNEERTTRLCVRLTLLDTDGWHDLNYGDVLFEPGRDNMDLASKVTVICENDDTDPGPRRWEIRSEWPHHAYLSEYSGPDWTRKAVGLYQMPIRLIIQEMIEEQ